jgi:glycosyltransferase involved in cell wall biosynthesis
LNRSGLPLATRPAGSPADVVFVYRGERTDLIPRIAEGVAPDEFLYGFPQVREKFPYSDFFEADYSGMALRRLLKPIEMLTVRLGFGIFFSTIVLNWKTVKRARLLVATSDSTGVPLLILKRLGLLPAKVVMISQGIHSIEADIGHLPWFEWLADALGKCLERASAIVCLGDGDSVAIQRSFSHYRLPEVVTIQFGIDHAFWHPAEEKPGPSAAKEGFVLSVGSDRMRDYPTLISAIDSTPLRLVTRLGLPVEAERPNIQVLSKLEWPQLRSLYQEARFVATPVKDQPRDSGHSATLQAMACGKTVILSDTAGLWDRENMKHGETCYLVEPGNPAAMRSAIQYLWSNPVEAARIGANARKLVMDKYSSHGFGSRLAEVIQRSLSDGSL